MIHIEESNDPTKIHTIMQRAFEQYRRDAVPSSALNETIETIKAALEAGERAFIAYINKQAVGMVRFTVVGGTLYFFRLSVIPAFRKQGVASALTLHLEAYAEQLTCRVRLSEPSNIKLYESLGYSVIAEGVADNGAGEVPFVTLHKVRG